MEGTPFTSKKHFKTLKIIHFALTAGAVLASIVLTLASKADEVGEIPPLKFIIPAAAIFGLAASIFIFKHLLSKALKQETLSAKLAHYYSANIVKFSLLEGPSLLASSGYFLHGNIMYLITAWGLILWLAFNRPSFDRAVFDLELNQEEKAKLQEPETIVTYIKQKRY